MRRRKGWIMDTYLLRRDEDAMGPRGSPAAEPAKVSRPVR